MRGCRGVLSILVGAIQLAEFPLHRPVEDEHHVHAEAAYPDLGTARDAGPSTSAASDVERQGESLAEAMAGRPVAENAARLVPAGTPGTTEIGDVDL